MRLPSTTSQDSCATRTPGRSQRREDRQQEIEKKTRIRIRRNRYSWITCYYNTSTHHLFLTLPTNNKWRHILLNVRRRPDQLRQYFNQPQLWTYSIYFGIKHWEVFPQFKFIYDHLGSQHTVKTELVVSCGVCC